MSAPVDADRLGRPRVLVIGVGNPYRRDDAAGREAVRRLRDRAPHVIATLEHDGEGTSLMEAWQGVDLVIVVDAVSSGAPPGTVQRFDVRSEPLPAAILRDSTHAVGVPDAVELARALGRLPPRLIVYGIEGRAFDAGEALSPEVERAVDEVISRILGDVQVEGGPPADA